MKTMTLTILPVLISCFLYGQSVLRYNFNNSLGETGGTGPALTILGTEGSFIIDTLNEISGKTKTVYRFDFNCGFQFDNLAAGNFLGETYTIELYFRFDNLDSWKRVVDWKNRKSDNGAYVYNGQINFYPYEYSEEAPVVPGEYTYYVITRDGATKNVRIYTDAAVQINFTDESSDAIPDEDHVLNFFFDDLFVPGEASPGAVALLNLYNYALDTTVIRANWNNLNSKVFGINDPRAKPGELKVYPNPATENLIVDLERFTSGPVMVSLVSTMGKKVFSGEYEAGTSCVINLRELALPPGIYVVQAGSGTKTFTRKLVVR